MIHGISYIHYLPPLSPFMISLTYTQHSAHLLSDLEVKETPPLSGSTSGDLDPYSLSPELGLFNNYSA